jgi:hypothetical protein
VGFTIQNGPGEGILGQHGAAFTVQNTTVQNNAGTGIAVGDGSTAALTDIITRVNRLGLDVFNSASAILRGAIAMDDNSTDGANVGGQSVLEIRGAHVQANNNSNGVGVVVLSSQLTIWAFSSSTGSTLTASGNGVGIVLLGGSQLTVFNSGTITAANNFFGIFAADAFIVSLSCAACVGSGEFVIEHNQVGLNFESGAGTSVEGGPLTIRNNGTGLLGDGAGTLTIRSDPSKPSSIVDNGIDVDLKFGTRATFDGVTIGKITCDATVLSRGSTVCP